MKIGIIILLAIIALVLFLVSVRKKNMPMLYTALIIFIITIAVSFFWGIHFLERLADYFKK